MSGRPRRYVYESASSGYGEVLMAGAAPDARRPIDFARTLRLAHSQLLALAESDVQAIHRKRRARRGGASRG